MESSPLILAIDIEPMTSHCAIPPAMPIPIIIEINPSVSDRHDRRHRPGS
jgi:hypothetical protein